MRNVITRIKQLTIEELLLALNKQEIPDAQSKALLEKIVAETTEWVNTRKELDNYIEDYVRNVCDALGLDYQLPKKLDDNL